MPARSQYILPKAANRTGTDRRSREIRKVVSSSMVVHPFFRLASLVAAYFKMYSQAIRTIKMP